VVIETPDPGADLEDRTPEEVVEWLEVLRQRLGALAQDPRIEFIQIFKNRGIMAGATLAHPHSQIVALPMIPPSNLGQLERQREGYRKTGVSVWDAVVAEELAAGVRVVRAEAAAVAFCPFAARVPYETCIVPNEKSPHFLHASEQTVRGVGFVLHEVLTSLARVAARPDYNILLHTAPVREERWRKEWDGLENWSRWWIEVVPRVGRFAGFELGTGMFINSLWPEEAARQLREQALPDNTKCAL
jgi:UDPglucose--hexose-1-phosphate uridylyltransferase